jgi:SEC-C motif-containing protein
LFAFQKATPEQVVRARYTAYAKREIDFIIQSTHPMNEKFVGDIAHWREQIDVNCYDNFELTKCAIVEEKVMDDDKTATVCFVANMVQRDSRERTSFQETSTFERVAGAWLYKEGVIADPPGREAADDEEEGGDDVSAAAEGDEIEAVVEEQAETDASPVVDAKIE